MFLFTETNQNAKEAHWILFLGYIKKKKESGLVLQQKNAIK